MANPQLRLAAAVLQAMFPCRVRDPEASLSGDQQALCLPQIQCRVRMRRLWDHDRAPMNHSRLLREPLFHFLLLGLLVWWLDSLSSRDEREEIYVGDAEVARIVALWERQWRRAPTEVELRNLVDDRIREEILYREALRMGLDEDDTVIRRRLAQKIAFVSEDRAIPGEASEVELQDFFAAHSNRYRRPATFSLVQVPFTNEAGEADARSALESLPFVADAALGELGSASMLPRRIARWTAREVAAEFGRAFLDGLEIDHIGDWQGPVASAFGHHAVRIDRFEAERAATLSEARRAVERDWLEWRRREANDAFYLELRKRYTVNIAAEALSSRPVALPQASESQ